MTDYQELREAAAADFGPEPWWIAPQLSPTRILIEEPDRRFIAACDPKTILALFAERDALREFARSIMEHWPESGVDGCDLQDIAASHGLLVQTTATEPCCDHCQCAEYHGEEDMKAGVSCYRRSALLTGVEAVHVPDA